MLNDTYSDIYLYIRGAIFILAIYHLLIFFQNKNKFYLYYSCYFFMLFTFFIEQGLAMKIRLPYQKFFLSIHLLTFYFYIQFARTLLNTKVIIPRWDIYLKLVSKTLLICIPLSWIIYFSFGKEYTDLLFYIVSPLMSIFTIITYFKLLQKKNFIIKYFVLGSFIYLFFANLTVVFALFYGIKGSIQKFNIHPTFFNYVGAILEAIFFALLIGYKVKLLEEEKLETIKKIDKLKEIVLKNHIVLKDKTKIYIADLLYIKSEDHFLKIFLSNGKNHFVRGKLYKILEELPPNFIRCHRSYVVNRNFIKQINNTFIVLVDKTEIPLARAYKDKI